MPTSTGSSRALMIAMFPALERVNRLILESVLTRPSQVWLDADTREGLPNER